MRTYLKILLLIAITVPSTGQTSWFISQESGNDTYSGKSPSKAFKSMNKARTALSPGDTLFFVGLFTNTSFDPDYQFTGNINDPKIWDSEASILINNIDGLVDKYIIFKAYDVNTRVRGDGGNLMRIQNSSYIIVEGFEMIGQVESIPLSTSLALQFVYKEANGAVKYRVPPGTPIDQIENLTLPVLQDVTRPSYVDTRGLYCSGGHHIIIRNNHIHHTPGNGLRVSEADYVVITNNEVNDCSRRSYTGTHGLVVASAASIDQSNEHKIFITNNVVHHNYNEIFSWSPNKTFINPIIDEGKGISLQRNTTADGWKSGRFLIANNVTYLNGFSGVHANDGERMDFIHNTAFMNSYTGTVYYANQPENQRGNQLGISAQSCTDISIINNVAWYDAQWGGFAISAGDVSNIKVENNVIYGINGSVNIDPDIANIQKNTVTANPKFANPDDFDFTPLVGSPLIDAAKIVTPNIVNDNKGNARDQKPDIGAIEFVNKSSVENSEHGLYLYPNPTTGILHANTQIGGDIVVYDLTGRAYTVQLLKTDDGYTIDLSSLHFGIYLVNISGKIAKVIKI